MNKFKLDLNNDPKSKDKTLINLISLLKQNNKLIIFDKYFNEFNLNEKKYIKDVIINKLAQNNFVIINYF